MKKYLFTLLGLVLGLGTTIALAAPSYTPMRSIWPEITNTYDLGTTTREWLNLFVKNITATGTSTLATTTMAFGSKIGNSSTGYMTVEDYSFSGIALSGSLPMIRFYSPNFPVNDSIGIFEQGLILYQTANDAGPELTFASKDFGDTINAGRLVYNTTTAIFVLDNVNGGDASLTVTGDISSTNLITSAVTNSYLATNGLGQIIATTTPLLAETDPLSLHLTDWYSTSTKYLTTTTAAATYQPIGSYLTSESDPIYSLTSTTILRYGTTSDSLTEGLVNKFYTQAKVWTDIWASSTLATILNNAQTAFSWGNHALAGYLTTISGLNISLLNNDAGYITSSSSETLTNKTGNISQWTNDSGYVTTTGSSVITIIATTTDSYDGEVTTSTLVGYQAVSDICHYRLASSHLCTDADINSYIANGGSIASWGSDVSTAWIMKGAPGYLANANDCNGWQSNSNTYLGPFWIFNSAGGGRGQLVNCSNSKPLACCR